MDKETCPCCHNHCSKDNLGCNRGKAYFDNQGDCNETNSLEEQVIIDLKECGHLLHHNREVSINKLLTNYSKEELNKLHELLSKILKN